ncbi:hypothetical protein BKA81DRAFT_347526 [Phyllosticta paracitricarpa]
MERKVDQTAHMSSSRKRPFTFTVPAKHHPASDAHRRRRLPTPKTQASRQDALSKPDPTPPCLAS